MSYKTIKEKLSLGRTVILDGGTGTDIQRRGAPMSAETWCADANLTHPEIVREVHEDYIAVGADMVTANTYASSPFMLEKAGRLDELERMDGVALAKAHEAAQGRVCVAGSMSTMRPTILGSDRNNNAITWSESDARRLFARKAKVLKDAGAEAILMEMMRDTDYARYASEAALETGLPVWIGISVEKSKSGGLQGWGREDCAFDDIIGPLAALKPDAMCIMHTAPNDIAGALEGLKKHWRGPTGVYPESGYFKSPDWDFVDVITPAALVDFAKAWQTQGVTILGGCCGTGPDHVAALAKEFKS